MNLFVAKLSSSTTGDELTELFSAYGEVTSAKIIFDRETGNSKGYGFVEMANAEEGQAAIAALNETELDGKVIVVKEANDREQKPSRPPYRGGGGGFQNKGGFQRRDDRGGDRGFDRGFDRRGGNGGGRRNDRGGYGGGGNRR